MFGFARTCQLPAVSMSPHVLVPAEKHEEENLQASFLFCLACLTFFAVVSLLISYLEAYKRRLVKFLLIPFAALQEGEEDDDEHLSRHLTQQNPNHVDYFHQFQSGHYKYDNPFGMSASKFAMETDRDVLYHAQVTLGCNGLRDLYNLGFMRQDTLERRIKAAGNRINLNSTVSLCAVWLREKIGRTFSTAGTLPSLKGLCLFLERRGCTRDMCCQILYDAFQKVDPSHADQVSLRVDTSVVLTSFRAVVDHIYDHWYQWLDESESPADVVELEPDQPKNDDGGLSYPAYNHNLEMLSPAEHNLYLVESLEQLHKGHDHHSIRDNDDAKRGAKRRQHPGHRAPFDLGQASSWGSEPNQSDKCATRLQDCIFLKKRDSELMKKMVMNPQRAALLVSTCPVVAANKAAALELVDSDLFMPRAVCHLRKIKGKESMDAESVTSWNVINAENIDDGMEEVDRFLAELDACTEGGAQNQGMASQAQDEARKQQNRDSAPIMEQPLLDSAPELGNEQGSVPAIMSDLHLGVGNKPVHGDPSYDPMVQDLFEGRSNLRIQKAKRLTALEMWDIVDGTTSNDDH
ncbi:hypothetical protein TrVGV298_001599 [Trichoderma virens]|nr:hypothetical protein TrVGV298_001599 [Trichoderma virens]